MTIGDELFAIVKPDGTVAGDGECPCLYSSKEMADDELWAMGDYLRGMNHCNDLRVIPVRLIAADRQCSAS